MSAITTKNDFKQLEVSTRSQFSQMELSFKRDMVELKFELLKWMTTTLVATGFGIRVAMAGMLKYMR